jgi:hypothetical protein
MILDPDGFSILDPGSNNNKKEAGENLVVLPFCSHYFHKMTIISYLNSYRKNSSQ